VALRTKYFVQKLAVGGARKRSSRAAKVIKGGKGTGRETQPLARGKKENEAENMKKAEVSQKKIDEAAEDPGKRKVT